MRISSIALAIILSIVLISCTEKKELDFFAYEVNPALKGELLDSLYKISMPNSISVITNGQRKARSVQYEGKDSIGSSFIEDNFGKRFGFRNCAGFISGDTSVIVFGNFIPTSEHLTLKIFRNQYQTFYNENDSPKIWAVVASKLVLSHRLSRVNLYQPISGKLSFSFVNNLQPDTIKYDGWFIARFK